MWIPLHSDQINYPIKPRMPMSDGWYIWHPDYGYRCNQMDLKPFTNREDAQKACNSRERALSLAVKCFGFACDDYKH